MKHILITLTLLIAFNKSFAQCLSVAEMATMFFKDSEAQDAFLDKKGYSLTKKPFHHISWKAKDSYKDTEVHIDYDEQNRVRCITFQGSSIKECYDALKSQVGSLQYIKDGESISKEGELSSYYSGVDFGVAFSKGFKHSDGSGVPYYFVSLMAKPYYTYMVKNYGNLR